MDAVVAELPGAGSTDSDAGPSDAQAATAEQAPAAGLSKNAQKKLRKQAEYEVKKAQRKADCKAKRRAERERWVAERDAVRHPSHVVAAS
jgi:hypothetical protein